ncbi:MAG TPA: hypothetical protein VK206_00925 [Anaerolineales bacterium]|nr:hypothetical protein [Anaerolineales bacterium]HLO31199.1 hypothetical protein [Anaerolineales bacterium]
MIIKQFEADKNLDLPMPAIRTDRHSSVWLWFTVPVAILLALASGSGVFRSTLYRDNPSLLAQAIGQDFISLVVVFPTLIISAVFASRGSPRARLVWLGALAYLVYTYASFAFDIRFNSLFLVYVALLGCSLYALIGGISTANMAEIKTYFTEKTPVKAVSIYLALIAVLFYFVWLGEIVPALIAGQIPQNMDPANLRHSGRQPMAQEGLGIHACRSASFLSHAYDIGHCRDGDGLGSGWTCCSWPGGSDFRNAIYNEPWNADLVSPSAGVTPALLMPCACFLPSPSG